MKIIRKLTTTSAVQKERPKNKITNYFILQDIPPPRNIMTFPFHVDVETFREQLNKENQKKDLPPYNGKILHACFDYLTEKIYLPEISSMRDASEPSIKDATNRLASLLSKGGVSFPINYIIPGDPYNLFRIKKISNFPYANEFIKKQLSEEQSDYSNLTVVEINIEKMPKTKRILKLRDDFSSVFIGGNSLVAFFNENDDWLYSVTSPLILINTSPKVNVSDAEKDMLVVESYKTFLEQKYKLQKDSEFRVKYLLYIGWSIKEICQHILNPDNISTMEDVIKVGVMLWNAATKLKQSGFKNPLLGDFYYAYFQLTPNANIRIVPQINSAYTSNQDFSPLISTMYDAKTSTVILKSRLYLSKELLKKILNIENVSIVTFDPYQTLTHSMSNVKSESPRTLKIINNDIVRNIQQGGNPPEFEQIGEENAKFYFERKKISDYPQAAEKIKRMCEVLSKPGKLINFEDLDVIVGPLSMVQQGMLGGYLSPTRAREQGLKIPIELFPGFFITPPIIIIDSVTKPNIVDRHDVLIHEYRHHINEKLGIPSPKYKIDAGDIGVMKTYLKSPDEIASHIQQAMYYLEIGMTKDQIVRKFLGKNTPLNSTTLPVARKYSEFVDIAEKDIEEQRVIDENNQVANQPAIQDSQVEDEDEDIYSLLKQNKT